MTQSSYLCTTEEYKDRQNKFEGIANPILSTLYCAFLVAFLAIRNLSF
jgi:hypothetical protein